MSIRPVHACVVALLAGLALAGPASAASVHTVYIDFGQVGCDATESTVFDALPGERNTVHLERVQKLSVPTPGTGGPCGEGINLTGETLVTDATATLWPRDDCSFAGAPVQNRAVSCRLAEHATYILRDMDDTLVLERGWAYIDAGPGNDHIEFMGSGRVICGSGHDTVITVPGTTIDPDCEDVYIR